MACSAPMAEEIWRGEMVTMESSRISVSAAVDMCCFGGRAAHSGQCAANQRGISMWFRGLGGGDDWGCECLRWHGIAAAHVGRVVHPRDSV